MRIYESHTQHYKTCRGGRFLDWLFVISQRDHRTLTSFQKKFIVRDIFSKHKDQIDTVTYSIQE